MKKPTPANLKRIAKAVREILLAIGEDPDRDGLRDTPARIARMYREVFEGLRTDPRQTLRAKFDEDHHEIVVAKNVSFYSFCEHHLLPFVGVAHIAYMPHGKIIGISKLARLVDALAKRPQVQERLTSRIADLLMEELRPSGVAVILEAEHMCMSVRGVKKPGSKIVTSAMRGVFRTNLATRSETMALIRGG
ncbi:MAG: GTP cyclohydrolase I FolE [Planctomycetota bacterium]